MGTTLTGTTPQDTYDSLIKVTDNGPLSGTAKYLSDGLGNDSALALSTGNIGIGTILPSNKLSVYTTTDYGNNSEYANATIGLGNQTYPVSIRSYRYGGSYLNGLDFYYNDGTPKLGLRINSTGNVGIGTSAPASKLQVESASGSPTITLSRLASGVSYELGNFSNSGSDLYFNGTANIFINADSNGDSTASDRNVIIGNRGVEYARFTTSGLTFNGDTAAANALDDYEEGTFTPFLSFSGGVTGITYSQQLGRYTKIGNVVNFILVVTLTNKGTSTGEARIEGLPFTIPSGGVNYAPFNIGAILNTTFNTLPSAVGIITTTYMVLEENVSGGAQSPLTQADFANNTEMRISGTYFV